jgi:hypothetical protein
VHEHFLALLAVDEIIAAAEPDRQRVVEQRRADWNSPGSALSAARAIGAAVDLRAPRLALMSATKPLARASPAGALPPRAQARWADAGPWQAWQPTPGAKYRVW